MITMAIARPGGFAPNVFHFNPEANVGDGSIPDGITSTDPELKRVSQPEEKTTTETQTETVPASTTH